MYEKHFSFKCKPFELVPNPDFLFLSTTHKKAITYLDYGIKEKIGFILLTGEIGSGKTTIIRNLIKGLNGTIKISRINNTKVSSEQLISMVNEDFGLDTEGKNKIKLLSELNDFLIDQYARGQQPVLLVDEAQNLSADLLEEVRLLSNLETDRAKLLQIILVGQPDLKRTLMLPELLQLRQRININYHISPLSMDETAQYIGHRLTVAGNPDAITCDDTVLYLIYQFSRGIPRLINILCDFSLLSAYVEGKTEVSIDVVKEVVDDLEGKDYFNDGMDQDGPGEMKDGASTVVQEDVKALAMKIIKLENTLNQLVQKSSSEILSLSIEKISQLEENMLMLSGSLERLEKELHSKMESGESDSNKVTEDNAL